MGSGVNGIGIGVSDFELEIFFADPLSPQFGVDRLYDISYIQKMKCTGEFQEWIDKLDRSLRIRIDQRIQRLIDGNPGLHRRFDNLLEIKWKTGKMGSFRVYCAEFEGTILLFGGHKDTQTKDIANAKALFEGIRNGKIGTEAYE